MAKDKTYDKLFLNIAEAVRRTITDTRTANAVAVIVLRSKYAILRAYSDINNIVKAEWMVDGQEKLDRHKCGACFTVAFEKRLIVADDNKQYESYREKAAIIAGMTILASFVECDAKKQGNHAILDHIAANNGLVIPGSSREQKEYEEIWAMELRRIYTKEQAAEAALSIADRLFLIEQYNLAMSRK